MRMTQAINWGDERLPERFWERTQPCPVSGCWIWTGTIFYGRGRKPRPAFYLSLSEPKVNARRLAYTVLEDRQPAAKKNILGTCGNTHCVNPLHTREAWSEEVAKENQRDLVRRYRLANKKRMAATSRYTHLKKMYGLGKSEYDAMLEQQSGACAICRDAFPADHFGTGKIDVDHCHTSGRVRALLCGNCNRGLGQFRDRPDVLRAAADYLEKQTKEQG